MRSLLTAAAAVLMAAASGPSTAAAAGRIEVLVTGADGGPVEGARITVTSSRPASQPARAVSDSSGRARLGELDPGAAVVRAEKPGYQAVEQAASVLSGRSVRVELRLEPLPPSPPPSPEELARSEAAASADTAVLALKLGDLDSARKAVEEALARDPRNARAWQLKGDLCDREEKHSEAADAYIQAVTLDPSRGSLLPSIVTMLKQAGRGREASEFEKKLGTLAAATVEDDYNLAVVRINAGEDAEALLFLEKALARKADYAPAIYQRGMIRLKQGDVPGSKADLKRYLELAPKGEFAETARELLGALGD